MTNINTKRIYEPFLKTDGYRILVDRLWPRGIKKEEAHIDKWMKDIAPSTELRKWIHQEPEKWEKFVKAYQAEIKMSPAIEELQADINDHKTVTLLFAARDKEHNHASVLKQYIEKHFFDT
jgi:uncharacterized protein YeaO (DUF488 family)